MFSVALARLFVCLYVCLSISNSTQKVMNWLRWNFLEGSEVVEGTSDIIVVVYPYYCADCQMKKKKKKKKIRP